MIRPVDLAAASEARRDPIIQNDAFTIAERQRYAGKNAGSRNSTFALFLQ